MPGARRTQGPPGPARAGIESALGWAGLRAVDAYGAGLGRVRDIRADLVSGEPAWLLIQEGRFGTGAHKLIPFEGAIAAEDRVWVPHERERVLAAPVADPDAVLTRGLADRLRAHFARGRGRGPSG